MLYFTWWTQTGFPEYVRIAYLSEESSCYRLEPVTDSESHLSQAVTIRTSIDQWMVLRRLISLAFLFFS